LRRSREACESRVLVTGLLIEGITHGLCELPCSLDDRTCHRDETKREQKSRIATQVLADLAQAFRPSLLNLRAKFIEESCGQLLCPREEPGVEAERSELVPFGKCRFNEVEERCLTATPGTGHCHDEPLTWRRSNLSGKRLGERFPSQQVVGRSRDGPVRVQRKPLEKLRLGRIVRPRRHHVAPYWPTRLRNTVVLRGALTRSRLTLSTSKGLARPAAQRAVT
jgi:hypothetical protein